MSKNNKTFLKRIDYKGNPLDFISIVCRDYDIGSCISYEIVEMGYEDLNIIIKTDKGKYFAKFFASFRDEKECSRYVNIMLKVLSAGVNHPKLYKSSQGYLHKIKIGKGVLRLCLMECIKGKTFYELGANPTIEESKFLANQAAIINRINIKPEFLYDQWAIVNFCKEYEEKGKYLSGEDKGLLDPLYNKFSSYNIGKLPYCFVHGDILKTNVIKTDEGKMYIIDFAVSNYYPRIIELAILYCFFMDTDDFKKTDQMFEIVINEYQKNIKLTSSEKSEFPFFLKLAHAMHILQANYQKEFEKNNSAENKYWLELGRKGLLHSGVYDDKNRHYDNMNYHSA
ncbi:phosphotransferase [Patescibacteria group bacterium]|nr:phosphotransferase [Patescibacteria group bacterium]MBU4579875.1 phosphotransferase [Patescibacteria group bacterium]